MGTGLPNRHPDIVSSAIGFDPQLRSMKDSAYLSRRMLSGLPPLWLLMQLPNMVSAHVAIQLELRGPNNTLLTDWIAGSQAIGEAFRIIQHGDATAMLAGGADCGVFIQAFLEYEKDGLLGMEKSGQRFSLAEGAGCMILEDGDHAIRREANIYGEIVGYSSGFALSQETKCRAFEHTMSEVMLEADWTTDDLDQILCASVLTPDHGFPEESALSQFIHNAHHQIKLVEYKSRIGHTLAASGVIETALAIGSLKNRGGFKILANNVGYTGEVVTLGYRVSPS
jgi:3-oxoacyl-[acyl-carrier-protein] synthase II